MNVLLQGATVYQDKALCRTDVLVQEGKIAQVGPSLAPGDAPVMRAEGMLVAPGFTDLHTHLRQPGYEAKETMQTGTAAGAAGGFTTLCAMPNLNPVPHDLQALAPLLAAIERDARVRVLPYGALTVNQQGVCLADIEVLSAFVAGFSEDGRGLQSEEKMRAAMQRVAAVGSVVVAHCEVEALLPQDRICIQQGSTMAKKLGCEGVSNQSEWAEVERDIALVRETGCRLHICHTSTAQSFELVRRAKKEGLPVTCEAAPHNLLLCCEDITEDNGRFRMNPPLRLPEDRRAALRALQDGTIDAIATDHAPHTEAEKSGPFQTALNGVVGLETAFPALYTGLVLPGHIPLEKLLSLLIEGPRRVLGEAPNHLQVGKKADLTLLNLTEARSVNPATFQSKGRSTPFEGAKLKGWPVLTLYDGVQVYARPVEER